MRTQTALAIMDALRPELELDVGLTLGEPTKDVQQRHVYLAPIGGAGSRIEYPVAAGGQWYRDDMFTIGLVAQYMAPLGDREAAMLGAEDLWFAVERALFGSGGFQRHVIDAVTDGDLLSIEIGSAEGPDPQPLEAGWMAGFVAELVCHGRLHSTR